MKLVIGTKNKNKLREIKEIMSDLPLEVVSLDEFPGIPDIVEDGKTLEENAVKKARESCLLTKSLTLADDTGLEVDCLNGEPGVYSARFAGPGCSYADNNKKLLSLLKAVPEKQRTARFRCVAAVAEPGGKVVTFEGRIEGYIINEMRGGNGFGYDPVFFIPEYNKTFAELTLEEKNRISHRALAVKGAKKLIIDIIKARR